MHFAPVVCDVDKAPKTVKSKAQRVACMWEAISMSPAAEQHIGEYLRLAKLLLTVVSGSVADERVFSVMEFVKCPRINRLQRHLELCVRVKAQSFYTLKTFPYEKALKHWHDASMRGRYHAT
jgi:hypothetical protein